jgi:hypothetical protein
LDCYSGLLLGHCTALHWLVVVPISTRGRQVLHAEQQITSGFGKGERKQRVGL